MFTEERLEWLRRVCLRRATTYGVDFEDLQQEVVLKLLEKEHQFRHAEARNVDAMWKGWAVCWVMNRVYLRIAARKARRERTSWEELCQYDGPHKTSAIGEQLLYNPWDGLDAGDEVRYLLSTLDEEDMEVLTAVLNEPTQKAAAEELGVKPKALSRELRAIRDYLKERT